MYKTIHMLEKNSPTILIGAGIACTLAGTVVACKATLKAPPIIEEHQEKLETIQKAEEQQGVEMADNPGLMISYTEQDAKKDLIKTYASTGLKLGKLYGPAILLTGVGISCILGSHKILLKRSVAISAAYATLDSCFKEYRQNIIDKYGEEADKEARFDIKAKKVKGKDGNPDTVTYEATDKTEKRYQYHSGYEKFFAKGYSEFWEDNAEYNLMFLNRMEQYCNDQLKSKGRLFLNEVYKMLGFEETKAGQVVGWVYDEKNPVGDNYVSFGIYDIKNPAKVDFVNGLEKAILLDFNVDGNIWDLM